MSVQDFVDSCSNSELDLLMKKAEDRKKRFAEANTYTSFQNADAQTPYMAKVTRRVSIQRRGLKCLDAETKEEKCFYLSPNASPSTATIFKKLWSRDEPLNE